MFNPRVNLLHITIKKIQYFGHFFNFQRSFYLSWSLPPATPSITWNNCSSILCGGVVCEEFTVNLVNLRWAVTKLSRIYGNNKFVLPCNLPLSPVYNLIFFILPSRSEFSPMETVSFVLLNWSVTKLLCIYCTKFFGKKIFI